MKTPKSGYAIEIKLIRWKKVNRRKGAVHTHGQPQTIFEELGKCYEDSFATSRKSAIIRYRGIVRALNHALDAAKEVDQRKKVLREVHVKAS